MPCFACLLRKVWTAWKRFQRQGNEVKTRVQKWQLIQGAEQRTASNNQPSPSFIYNKHAMNFIIRVTDDDKRWWRWWISRCCWIPVFIPLYPKTFYLAVVGSFFLGFVIRIESSIPRQSIYRADCYIIITPESRFQRKPTESMASYQDDDNLQRGGKQASWDAWTRFSYTSDTSSI